MRFLFYFLSAFIILFIINTPVSAQGNIDKKKIIQRFNSVELHTIIWHIENGVLIGNIKIHYK